MINYGVNGADAVLSLKFRMTQNKTFNVNFHQSFNMSANTHIQQNEQKHSCVHVTENAVNADAH